MPPGAFETAAVVSCWQGKLELQGRPGSLHLCWLGIQTRGHGADSLASSHSGTAGPGAQTLNRSFSISQRAFPCAPREGYQPGHQSAHLRPVTLCGPSSAPQNEHRITVGQGISCSDGPPWSHAPFTPQAPPSVLSKAQAARRDPLSSLGPRVCLRAGSGQRPSAAPGHRPQPPRSCRTGGHRLRGHVADGT